jgi:hypothetical protein
VKNIERRLRKMITESLAALFEGAPDYFRTAELSGLLSVTW